MEKTSKYLIATISFVTVFAYCLFSFLKRFAAPQWQALSLIVLFANMAFIIHALYDQWKLGNRLFTKEHTAYFIQLSINTVLFVLASSYYFV